MKITILRLDALKIDYVILLSARNRKSVIAQCRVLL